MFCDILCFTMLSGVGLYFGIFEYTQI